MKTILLTNGIETQTYEVPDADFPQAMNLAKLTAESWGEGWEAKEPTPEVIEEPIADTIPPNDETPIE